MTITQISGEIAVRVDEVALEQVCLNHPKSVEGFPVPLQAMVAALHSEDVVSFQRQLGIPNYTLEYVSAYRVKKLPDVWEVKFAIVRQRQRETV